MRKGEKLFLRNKYLFFPNRHAVLMTAITCVFDNDFIVPLARVRSGCIFQMVVIRRKTLLAFIHIHS
jgi:hypothetical protein